MVIYIISNILLILCLAILLMGLFLPENKITKKVYNILFYFDKYSKKERERFKEMGNRKEIYENGTPEDIISYNNSMNPDYQMLTDKEVLDKYSNIPKEKIEIIDVPSVIYNSDEKRILHDYKERYEVKNNKLVLKSGNKIINVDTHKRYPKSIKDGYKLLIFRHKTNNYRFKVLELV